MADPEPPQDDTPTKPDLPGFVPAIILKNKGVPITLYRLENGELPEVGDEEEQPARTWHLRLTANHVAEIEEAFDGFTASVPLVERTVATGTDGEALIGPAGPVYHEKVVGHEVRNFYGLEAFQKAMEVKLNATARRVLAIALGCSPEQAGRAMDPSRMIEYQTAISVAWSIAQGVDPTVAARTLHRAKVAAAKQLEALGSELTRMTDEGEGETTDSPGQAGAQPGSPRAEA